MINKAQKKTLREKRVVNYHHATSFAFLYNISPKDPGSFFREIYKQLQSEGKSVEAIGYFNGNQLSADLQVPPATQLCQRKDFSWIIKPRSIFLKGFAAKKYDILIDLTNSQSYPMKYLAAISRAKYKVGRQHPDFFKIYDFIMDVDESCPPAKTSEHIFHYLKILKTPGHDQSI